VITENEARELLARAAGTIEEPSGELDLQVPQLSRWVAPMIAAAAIAAAVATGVVLVHNGDRHDQPGPVAPTPTPDRFKGVIPPVFAYDSDSAQQMLEDRGLRVRRTVVTNKCEAPDRALRTRPDVGFPVVPGDSVTLYVSGPLVAFCNPPELLAWSILDFANGRGPEPRMAEGAKFYLNGERTTLRKVSDVLARETKNAETASLHVEYLPAPRPCSTNPSPFPAAFINRRSYWMDLVVPTDGFFSPCQSSNVFTNASGEIDGILIEAAPFLINPPKPTPRPTPNRALPGIAAHFINFAKGWMQRPGFAESIRLYNDGSLVATLDHHSALDRSSFFLCPGSAHPAQCGLSPIELIKGLHGTQPTVSTRADCFNGSGILPHRSGQGTLLITDPGVPPCESSWVVQLDYDDQYKIVAVNEFSGAS